MYIRRYIYILTLALPQSLPRVQLQLHISLHTPLQYFGHNIPVLQTDTPIDYYSKHLTDHPFEYLQDSSSPQFLLTKDRGGLPAVLVCSSSELDHPYSWSHM